MSEIADTIVELAHYAAGRDTVAATHIAAAACRQHTMQLFVSALFQSYWRAATMLHSDLGMQPLRDWLVSYSLRPDFDNDLRLAARVILDLDLAADTATPEGASLREIAVATFEELAGVVDDTGRTNAVIGGIAVVFAAALPVLHHPPGLDLLARCAEEVTGE